MKATEVKGKHVVIIGGKRSGLAAARLLRQHGAKVFLTEREPLKDPVLESELKRLKIEYEFGGHTEKIFDADFGIISPGVPSNAPVVRELEKAKIKLYSEIEMASWFCKAKIVAITGTNGKTTTTLLAKAIFERDGKEKGYRAFAVGNIGQPFSDYVDEMTERDVAVVETSSFQLEHCYTYKPKVAVITNITPNHLDRYATFEDYAAAKYRIYQKQTKSDALVVNLDNDTLRQHFGQKSVREKLKMRFLPISLERDLSRSFDECGYLKAGYLILKLNGQKEVLMREEEISNNINFRGKHNVYNSLAAAVAARAMEVRTETIRESIKGFQGVEHRIEFVRELDGVQFINDSKSTSVDALWYALDTIPAPIVLILGGRDKGNDYSKVIPLVEQKVKRIVAIGESKDKIYETFSSKVAVQKVDTMDDAVRQAYKAARAGDTILLSPACTSFDMFSGFEERGEVFKRLVNSL
ncbi:MAG: UDP-N-acetylmuramoyl-L-alanine--D-glutamate ligase [Chloroherpetonaceae bacterium]|nr:UDP-N-acetylmuramoyl-L-alanine--D-glutamate ligase [Chloroherpetonaceae bacterium]MCS7210606.1 UDP-N-acetylmuramoyl-L-alanine--D-glutamate ligase [Chloroherpetonaceae bacterium]MDW8020204.1 UDP-N-acetylmuramoyl-L-alanine--D-glutamate ligase [Chloroherpetonaceae bacterium]